MLHQIIHYSHVAVDFIILAALIGHVIWHREKQGSWKKAGRHISSSTPV